MPQRHERLGPRLRDLHPNTRRESIMSTAPVTPPKVAGTPRVLRPVTRSAPVQPAPENGTVLLSRGSGTVTWTGGDIILYEGDVSAYGTIRVAASAYTECGGLDFSVVETANPAIPVVLRSSRSERNFHQIRTVLDTPGQRIAVRVWIDDCPTGKIELTWGVWGRPG